MMAKLYITGDSDLSQYGGCFGDSGARVAGCLLLVGGTWWGTYLDER